MTRTLFALIAVVALALSTPASARPEARTAPYTFAFKDADLADVAEAILGRTLNLTYSIDPDLTGKISFRIERRMTPSELLQAFEATLALSDIALVKNGQTLVLEKRAKARASSAVAGSNEDRHAIGYQTLAVPITKASPGEVAKALQAMGQGGVIAFVDETQGQIVLNGTAQEIEVALKAIRLFDKAAEAARSRFFPLRYADAKAIAEEVQGLMRGAGVQGISLIPVKRLNGVSGFPKTEAALNQIGEWLQKLDVPSGEASGTLFLYHPKTASAENLKAALGGVSGQGGLGGSESSERTARSEAGERASALNTPRTATPARDSTAPATENGGIGLLGEGVRLGVDKETNTLLVSCTASQWKEIQKLLIELDKAPGQVLIEASILEVTLSKDNRLGLDFSVIGPNRKLNVTQSGNAGGAVTGTFPGFSVTYVDANLKAAVTALGSNSRVEVISAPKIMALDNKTATIDVGDQVPVVTQSAQSTLTANAPQVNSVDYRNTGVILKVTPRITGEDTILLDVSQEVSSVAATTTSGIDSPTILQRRLESSLILNDGGVVALGGMISSNRSRGDSGVPILKDAPIVGALFKTASNDQSRTELVVLLTAHIVRDRAGAERALNAIRSDMREIKADAPKPR